MEAEELRFDSLDGMTREEAWADYFAKHPEVLASWAHQNGYWPYGYTPDGIQEEE